MPSLMRPDDSFFYIQRLRQYHQEAVADGQMLKLINGNRQRGNNPLDIGLAALELSMGKASEYARRLGVSKQPLSE